MWKGFTVSTRKNFWTFLQTVFKKRPGADSARDRTEEFIKRGGMGSHRKSHMDIWKGSQNCNGRTKICIGGGREKKWLEKNKYY